MRFTVVTCQNPITGGETVTVTDNRTGRSLSADLDVYSMANGGVRQIANELASRLEAKEKELDHLDDWERDSCY